MLSTILAAVKGIFALLGWAKQASDIQTGEHLQAGKDAEATVKEATDAKAIDARDAGLSDAALDAKLRRPASGS